MCIHLHNIVNILWHYIIVAGNLYVCQLISVKELILKIIFFIGSLGRDMEYYIAWIKWGFFNEFPNKFFPNVHPVH